MSLRSISFAFIVLSASLAPAARGDTLLLQLFPFTGEARLTNSNPTTFTFVFYSLTSPGGALIPNSAVWQSITEVYDAPSGPTPGNGYIDPVNSWLKLDALSTKLTEGVVPNPGGSLAPFRSVSLGNVWNVNATANPDVTGMVTQSDNNFANVIIDFSIAGDYNQDDKVDAFDYQVWKNSYGQSGTLFSQWADGNLDGTVNAADYTVWRNNLGLDLSSFGFASSTGGIGLGMGNVVPEPGAVVLLLTLAAAATLFRCPRLRFGLV